MILKNKTKKLIASILLILIIAPAVLFSRPKQAEATGWPVMDILGNIFLGTGTPSTLTNTGLHFKDIAIAVLQQLVTTYERKLLQQMTQDTINWINSGFHGSPLFVQNPDSFFGDIAKYEIKNLVNMFGYDLNKYPFGESFALNLINGYKRTLESDAQYSLSKVINDPVLLSNYRNNFNVGGWNGFLINTQYPQNNYLGFQMMATDVAARKLAGTVQTATQKVQTTLSQGMGFLSPQSCPSNPTYNNGTNEFQRPSFDSDAFNTANPPPDLPDCESMPKNSASAVTAYQKCTTQNRITMEQYQASFTTNLNGAKAAWAKKNDCPGGLVNTTPGSVAGNQIMKALGASTDQATIGGVITNSLSAIFDSLLNHFIGKGLTALTSTINPAPPVDTWSYKGNTLSNVTGYTPPGTPSVYEGTTSASTINFNNTTSKNISTSPNNVTNIILSGGTAPYGVKTQPSAEVAVAQVFDTTLMIAGIGSGQTSIIIQDSGTPAKTVTIQIASNSESSPELSASAQSVSGTTDKVNNVTLSGGTMPYEIDTAPDMSVAQATISDTNLIVIGVGPGSTLVVVKDSSFPTKTLTIPITISADTTATSPAISPF